MKKFHALIVVSLEIVGFGAYALYLGYNSVVIGSVFAALGTIAGYIVGKAAKED